MKKRSCVYNVIKSCTGPPWPEGHVSVCFGIGWSSVCESENVCECVLQLASVCAGDNGVGNVRIRRIKQEDGSPINVRKVKIA